MLKVQRGFTLIEVIVVAGIIAILAGILVPIIFKEIDEAKITRAAADIRSISSALIVLKKDTGQWPVYDNACNQTATLVAGSGNVPTNYVAMGFDGSIQTIFDDFFIKDAGGCYRNWKGPYMASVTFDPWSNAYIMNVKEFPVANSPVWIISAGPNGLLDTNASDNISGGDDIGLRLK